MLDRLQAAARDRLARRRATSSVVPGGGNVCCTATGAAADTDFVSNRAPPARGMQEQPRVLRQLHVPGPCGIVRHFRSNLPALDVQDSSRPGCSPIERTLLGDECVAELLDTRETRR